MRHFPSAAAVAVVLAASPAALAQAAPPSSGAPAVAATPSVTATTPVEDPKLERLVLDDGRVEALPPDRDAVRLTAHGEYQLRYTAASTLPLEPPVAGASRPTTLGQNQFLYHWLRVTPRFEVRDKLAIVAQLDMRGLVVGDTTQLVGADAEPLDQAKWYGLDPRWLYLEYTSPVGLFRVGQQSSHWGMGLVANDGDHATLFGDYRGGAIDERVLFATTPFGRGTPVVVAVAADLVYRDATASLLDHDRAYQGVAVVAWRAPHTELGLYGVVRHQERNAAATSADLTAFTESLTAGVLDAAGRFDRKVPGSRAVVYGSFELATIVGHTNMVRFGYLEGTDPEGPRPDEQLRSFGGAAVLGVVDVRGAGEDAYGRLVGEVEYGYASGDADPYDGTTKRFTFDPSHHVGLVLFDQVMRWKTARAATIAGQPELVARAAPGTRLLPSDGGVFGATYLNPRFVYRPMRGLDLKLGAVIAQTTADFVDPFRAGALGSYRNYDGGRASRHDLGVELDAGVDGRIHVEHTGIVNLGVEGGVLIPGQAFDDAAGNALPTQYLATVKAGVDF